MPNNSINSQISYWVFPANLNYFDIHKYISDYNGLIYWNQAGCKPSVGDIVYMYVSRPEQKLRYCMRIVGVNIHPCEEIFSEVRPYKHGTKIPKKYCRLQLIKSFYDDRLSNSAIKENHFLSERDQFNRKIKISPNFLSYIDSVLCDDCVIEDIYEVPNRPGYPEGAVETILVNRYERNPENRRICIEHHGVKCLVCGFDFENLYGEMGRGFIHVHHIVPLSTIGHSYVIDPITELIPVCPNCHAMLHKIHNGEYLSVKQLKSLIEDGNGISE